MKHFFCVNLAENNKKSRFFVVPQEDEYDDNIPIFNEKELKVNPFFRRFILETGNPLSVHLEYILYEINENSETNSVTEDTDILVFESLIAERNVSLVASNDYVFSLQKKANKGGVLSWVLNHKIIVGIAGGTLILLLIIAGIASNKNKGGDNPVVTDENGNIVTEIPLETDEYGNIISEVPPETDEYGNIISEVPPETDEYGNIISEVPPETDEYGNIISEVPAETDEYGNIIVPDNEKPEHVLQFNLMGGLGNIGAVNVKEGMAVDLPTKEKLTKDGYEFVGWTDDPSISYPIFDFVMPTEDVTLYAVWQELPGNRDGNTGNTSTNSSSTDSGNSQSTSTEATTTETKQAQTEAPKPKEFSVTLIGNGENSAQIMKTVKEGDTLDLTKDFGFVKYGYYVSSWTSDKGVTLKSLKPTSDTTLYANWKESRFVTVTLDYSFAEKENLVIKSYTKANGKAEFQLPSFDPTDVYNHVPGFTYGWSTVKGGSAIEFYGGEKVELSKDTKLYRVLGAFGGGFGTKADPYLISYYDQLELLARNGAKGYFKQVSDIVFPDGYQSQSIDCSKNYSLKKDVYYDHFVYDGNGFEIRGLTSPLFGELIGAEIKNITIRGADIKLSGVNTDNVGVIAKDTGSYKYELFGKTYTTGDSKITNCNVINSKITVGEVIKNNSNEIVLPSYSIKNIGGIVGNGSKIYNCLVQNFTVTTAVKVDNIGGIAGTPNLVNGSQAIDIKISSNEELRGEILITNAGGIVGNARGTAYYPNSVANAPKFSGGSIIGSGIRTLQIIGSENAGGIAGVISSSAVTPRISSCFAADLNLYDKEQKETWNTRLGSIAGKDGSYAYGSRITFVVVPQMQYLGSSLNKSTIGDRVMKAPEYAFKIESILSVLNRNSAGFSSWVWNEKINNGYPYQKKIDYIGGSQ